MARRFGIAGHPVGHVARDADRLAAQAAELSTDGVVATTATADVTRPDEVAAALVALAERLGWVQVLCISPLLDVRLIKPVTATTADDLGTALAPNVVGPAAAVQAVLPAMQARRQGTVLATTGSAASTRAPSGPPAGPDGLPAGAAHVPPRLTGSVPVE